MAKTKTKVTCPGVKALLDGIVTPVGFTRKVERIPTERRNGQVWTYGYTNIIFTGPKPREIVIEVHLSSATGERRRDDYYLGTGHVSFKGPDGVRRSYDRHGVDDSFYVSNPLKWPDSQWAEEYNKDPILEANTLIAKFINERVPESCTRIATSEPVPGMPGRVTPEQKAAIVKKLKAGGAHNFTPAGFGTGYTVSKRVPRWGGHTAANKDLCDFFGIGRLYVTRFDHD